MATIARIPFTISELQSEIPFELSIGGGGGGGAEAVPLHVTANGTYNAPIGTAYNPVEVAVPVPEGYADVTGVTVYATEVLIGKKYVNARGILKTGLMPLAEGSLY